MKTYLHHIWYNIRQHWEWKTENVEKRQRYESSFRVQHFCVVYQHKAPERHQRYLWDHSSSYIIRWDHANVTGLWAFLFTLWWRLGNLIEYWILHAILDVNISKVFVRISSRGPQGKHMCGLVYQLSTISNIKMSQDVW